MNFGISPRRRVVCIQVICLNMGSPLVGSNPGSRTVRAFGCWPGLLCKVGSTIRTRLLSVCCGLVSKMKVMTCSFRVMGKPFVLAPSQHGFSDKNAPQSH